MNKVQVIDQIMGSGKTEGIINEMGRNRETKYLYVGPLLTEVERVLDAVVDMSEPDLQHKPEGEDTASKLSNIKDLLRKEKRICTTHALFQRFDNETVELLEGYTLILDETMECIRIERHLTDLDYQLFIDSGICSVDAETQRVHWKSEHSASGLIKQKELRELKNQCDMGSLYYKGYSDFSLEDSPEIDYQESNKKHWLWVYPPQVFKAFDVVKILTYNFENTPMHSYFQIHGMEVDIEKKDDTEEKIKIRDRIFLVDDPRYNSIGEYRLSWSGYRAMQKDKQNGVLQAESIGNALEGVFRTYGNGSKQYNMWTCYKDQMNYICKDGKKLKYRLFDNVDHSKVYKSGSNEGKCSGTFIYHSAKAVNQYGHKKIVAYPIDKHINNNLNNILKWWGHPVDVKKYALNEMTQWIWRSAIRNKDKIILFIPKPRMRDMFVEWLGKCEIITRENVTKFWSY